MQPMDRETELEHLRKAEAGIAKAHERIEHQEAILATLKEGGHDLTTAMTLLETMRETLTAMQQHRQLILQELDRR
jgi:hypothetical protein